MKKNLTFIIIAITAFMLFIGNVNGQSKNTATIINSQKQKTVKFVYRVIKKNEEIGATVDIYLVVGGKKNLVSSALGGVHPVEGNLIKERYPYTFPDNAIAACLVTNAGSAEYFYAVKTKKGYDIFHAIDEEGSDEGYEWEKIKAITPK